MSGVFIAIIIIAIIIFVWRRTTPDNFSINGNVYAVHKGYENYETAAEHLDKINNKLIKFFRYLKDKYVINHVGEVWVPSGPNADERRAIIERMLSNYNPEVINENDPATSSDTSYTIMKGKELHVCLREKTPPYRLHNINDMMFVILHEIAHMGNDTWGHDDRFWSVFKFVLHEAKLAGIHDPIDYRLNPITYCGLIVNYSPYYDNTIRRLW